MVLSSNFGLLVSTDGTNFHWICEAVTGTNASLYQVGPDGTAYAVSSDGLKRGGDGYCAWDHAGGSLADAAVADVFPDPSNASHVLALARPINPDNSFGPLGLYESNDGARTFGAPLFTAQTNEDLTGVEVARTDRNILYVTLVQVGSTLHPYVVRSTDGGANWERIDAQPTLGNKRIRLAAVDPVNPQRLYLRVTDVANSSDPDTLAISDDGGASFRIPTRPDGSPLALIFPMTAFLRRADGGLLIGIGYSVSTPVFISTDDGRTFSPVTRAPHVRGLAERDGVIYAATNDQQDGFALAISTDGGLTWQPKLGFDQICGPLQCGGIPDTCASTWDYVRLTVGVPMDACKEAADAGTGNPPPTKKGCGCAQGGLAEVAGLGALLFVLSTWHRRRHRP